MLCTSIPLAPSLARMLALLALIRSHSSPLLTCRLLLNVAPHVSARPARSRSLAPLAPSPQSAFPSSSYRFNFFHINFTLCLLITLARTLIRFLSLVPLLVCSLARSARPFLLVACSCSSPLTSVLALLVLVRSHRSPLPLDALFLLHLKHSISFI